MNAIETCLRSIRDAPTAEVRQVTRYLAMLLAIKAGEVLKRRWLRDICCYSDQGERIDLKKIIQTDQHVRVVSGEMKGKPLIIKWYKSEKRDTSYEIDTYRRLRDMKCPSAMVFYSIRSMGRTSPGHGKITKVE